ncbi:MAG: metallophosphoesterase [bacterium]|nr:metallophosphoesterase [bacterium]
MKVSLIVFFIYVNSLIFVFESIPESPPLWMAVLIEKPFWIWMVSSIMLFLIYLIKDIAVSIYRGIRKLVTYLVKRNAQSKESQTAEVDSSRRKFLKVASAGLALPPIVLTSYGVISGSSDIFENKLEMHFPQLPENLRGLKVAHFTDVHCDEYTSKEMISKAVGIINDSDPDLVLLTGDYVSNGQNYIYPCVEALKEIKSKHGVYASMGNHDHWAGLQIIISEFEKNGIPVLHNKGTVLTINEAKIDLLGVDDSRWGSADIQQALRSLDLHDLNGNGTPVKEPVPSEAEGNNFRLLMSHQPPYWDVAREHGIDLVLAGHTHGGQISVDIFGSEISLVDLFSNYIKGTYTNGNSQLYVSPGFGFTGPPFRLNNPPEVAIITLG